jgi:mono/diheme cytochrome c family protein
MAVCVCGTLAWGQVASSSDNLERGKYLVNNIGMCNDCHTPHNEKGEAIAGKTLFGATLDCKPTVTLPMWAPASPGIAGLTDWSDADIVSLLSTGKMTNGMAARPPMPRYRLTKEDAEAVVHYLHSLPPAPPQKKAGK